MTRSSKDIGLIALKHRAELGATLAILALAALSTWLWWNASEQSRRSAGERFAFRVSEIRFALAQRLLAYEQVLRGGVGLFAAGDDVTRDDWSAYVRALRIEQNYPGVQGIGFARRVALADREAHIAGVRAEGFSDYTILPTGKRDEYTSIVYLEPFDWRNQRAFGYDMFSESIRHAAMVRARDKGLPSVSGKVKLVQETNHAAQNGFLMYLPVYRNGSGLHSVEARRAALVGYVYAPFRMSDLMEGILGADSLPNIHFQIFDGPATSPVGLMYDSLGTPTEMLLTSSAYSVTEAFEFNGRQWIVRFRSLPAFEASIDVHKPRLILAIGLLVTLLFAAVMWSLLLNQRRARELASANSGLQAEIAQRTKLERELKQAKETADAASDAKSDFLANVSHELRTPLTLILAPLEQLLAAQQPMADWRPQLERVQRNGLLLLNRVNDILDFSKAEAGKFEVCWEAVDLVDLISTLAGDAKAIAETKGSALSWRIDPAIDIVCADRRHLEKILLNLLSNALKFTPSGGDIRVEVAPIDDDRFEIAVADSGIGIASEKLPLLFKRFQQVDTSATREYGGTGIGLALVKELAELMGGAVEVQSEPGRGARFVVRLARGTEGRVIVDARNDAAERARALAESALRHVRLLDGARAATIQEKEETASHRASLPKALVVDDNADMRDYIAAVLRDDCDVLTADDGEHAWAQLQRHCIDVIISDVMMPGLDGNGLVRRVKASPTLSHVPAILVTARGGAEASAVGLEGGADDYIAKPFSPLELKARVRAALRMAGVQEQLRDKSREAGMGMVATGILHNLGNILSGVTVYSGVIKDQVRQSALPKLCKAVRLLEEHGNDLPRFIAEDSRGQVFAAFLAQLTARLEREQAALVKEVDCLKACAEHVAGVIATDHGFGRNSAELREMISVTSLMENALTLKRATFDMHGIAIERDYDYTGSVAVDRHKILQILLNLLSNARQAMDGAGQSQRLLRVRTAFAGGRIRLEISDNGRGIDPLHLPLLFNHGFTTKTTGHGFGLHSSANWARESGGTLTCHSDGLGRGTTFILEIPACLDHRQDIPATPLATVISN